MYGFDSNSRRTADIAGAPLRAIGISSALSELPPLLAPSSRIRIEMFFPQAQRIHGEREIILPSQIDVFQLDKTTKGKKKVTQLPLTGIRPLKQLKLPFGKIRWPKSKPRNEREPKPLKDDGYEYDWQRIHN